MLSDLQLGDSLTTIGEKALYRSPQLREVSIPDSVIRIGHDAFAGTGITTEVLPSHFSDNPPTEAFEPGTVFSYRNEESIDSGELTNSCWQSQSNSGLWTKEAVDWILQKRVRSSPGPLLINRRSTLCREATV